MNFDDIVHLDLDNECVSCQEIIKDKSIYLLPCLHQLCSDCLEDLKKLNNLISKYKCVLCHEQFDFQITIRQNYSNNFFTIEDPDISLKKFQYNYLDIFKKIDLYYEKINTNEEYLKSKKIIDNLVIKTTRLIEELNSIIESLN
jgi:hypothetical protein